MAKNYRNNRNSGSQNRTIEPPKMDVQMKNIIGKKSGKERTAIHAWRTSKRFGLVVLDAVSTELVKTKDGVEYMGFVCKIKTQFSLSTVSGLYNESKGVLWIPELRLVVSPRQRYFKVLASK